MQKLLKEILYRFAPGKEIETAKEELMAFVANRARLEFMDESPLGARYLDNPCLQKFLETTNLPQIAKRLGQKWHGWRSSTFQRSIWDPGIRKKRINVMKKSPNRPSTKIIDISSNFFTVCRRRFRSRGQRSESYEKKTDCYQSGNQCLAKQEGQIGL